MKRRIMAILTAAMTAAAVSVFSCAEEASPAVQDEDFDQPYLVQITEDDPSSGYVLVRLQDSAGLLPLPQEGEYSKTIRQVMADGSEMVNVVHVTPEGFRMEKSDCEGQDCVGEGEVTMANREERILGNAVICLPHRLTLYLITREEAEAMLGVSP